MRFRLAPLLALSLLAVSLDVFPARAQTAEPPVVHAILFWMDGCPHCHEVLENVLPPLQAQYGAQLEILMVEVVSMDDVNRLYEVAAAYGIPRENTGVPFMIIGDHVLIGSRQIPDELPGLIERYLAQGGVERPVISNLADFPSLPPRSAASASSPTPNLPAVIETPFPADTTPDPIQPNGFTLAIVIMVGMALALLYSLIAFAMGKTFSLPAWGDWLIPAVIVVGMGVAAYLSYVETQSVEAFCGPVGDCNTVQQSRYAKLFGVLPVGVLGLLGYFALLAAWLTRRFIPKLEKPAAIGFWGIAFFAVIFSLYLTYLEPFVIRAVCIWCLSSAVIVTLLLLLGTPPAIRQFSLSEEE
jgi:uncharacterized membrane protein/thiol-disulfide isomerase/thioredoxin